MPHTYTAFSDHQLIASGPIPDVALQLKSWQGPPYLIFEDHSGQQIDLDLRGTDAEILARLADHPWLQRHDPDEKRTGPGRPKLGVVSREVSLLPKQWEWLNAQRGGASATLRKLVDEQMRATVKQDQARRSAEAVGKVMWVLAGNLPGFEEASRALSRKEYPRFSSLIDPWPTDLRDHLRRLAATAEQHEKEAHHGDSV